MSPLSQILVADDEAESSRRLGAVLEKDGYSVRLAPDGGQARKVLESEDIDLLIAELALPSPDGFELLQMARQLRSSLPVILISGFGTVETAVQALKQGAYHYFQKPLDMDAVRATVAEALMNGSRAPAAQEPAARRPTGIVSLEGLGIVGRGPWLAEALDLVRRVAPTRATVLLSGESGTGKELFARAIHRMNGRQGPFVAVSCAALSRDLLESELFGHERGAFTGAERQKPGRFELAHGGTLFLDEIGEVPLDLQVKLLRVLQERQFERVGGTESLSVDVRIIAASNRDLAVAVQERTFREDLYYRLKVVEIVLPPLRERIQDVEPLARHFLQSYARANGKHISDLDPAVLQLMEGYAWPGNARELENVIERAVVLADPWATMLEPSLLPEAMRRGHVVSASEASMGAAGPEQPSLLLHRVEEEQRLTSLQEALKKAGGNAARAARLLGVSPRSVRYYADKYGLRRRVKTPRGL